MTIDIIICIVILISAAVAFFRGFIREILTILGVLGGLFAAYTFGDELGPIFAGWMGASGEIPEGQEEEKFLGLVSYVQLATILAYTAIFIVVVIILSIISHMLSKFVESVGMGMLDRTLGVVFGIARGIVLLGILYLPIHMFVAEEEKEEWFEGARLHVYLELTADWLSAFLPEELKEEASEEQMNQARETLKNLDILPQGEGLIENLKNDLSGPQSQPEEQNNQGYNEGTRSSLDTLIEQQNEPAPPEEQAEE